MRPIDLLSLIILGLAPSLVVHAQYQPLQLPADARFTSNAEVRESKENRFRITTTGDKNGVRYSISHTDAQGLVEGVKGGSMLPYSPDTWRVSCHSYPDPSSKTCGLYRYGIALLVYSNKSTSGEWLTATNDGLGVSGPSSIEVDGTVIFRDNKMTANAFEELSKGKKATVRVPPDINVPDERVISFDLYGFNEAVELCRWAIKQVK